MPQRLARNLLIAAVAAQSLALSACSTFTFEGPPLVTIQGLEGGLLTDRKAPIVLTFSKPYDPKTLRMKIARYQVDLEGNLLDEDTDEATQLDLFYTRDDEGNNNGGVGVVGDDHTTFTVTMNATLPVGAALVVLIEKGLTGEVEKGEAPPNPTVERRRIKFGYDLGLNCNSPTQVWKTGAYFWLADVLKPISAQVQLFAFIEVDPATGRILGQFTNADRNPAAKCPTQCTGGQVCRLVPTPQCVVPSERAGTVDEFSDYVPNNMAPTGYSFRATGCAEDQDGKTVAFAAGPVDVEVLQPHVTLRNAALTAAFTLDDDGVLRGTGSLAVDDVLLGTVSSGKGEGGLSARSLTDEEAPPGIPKPEPDGGAP